jgi:hypothetical protein
LYELAFSGGSVAPLETQYQQAWNNASKRVSELTTERDRLVSSQITPLARTATTENVYTLASENKKLRDNQARLAQVERELAAAEDDKNLTLERLRQAQTDKETSAPGAIWNPTIARLLGNKNVQSGIRRGLEIERNDADAQGRPMNISEYAVVGTDPTTGDPIVSSVPNTRLFGGS